MKHANILQKASILLQNFTLFFKLFLCTVVLLIYGHVFDILVTLSGALIEYYHTPTFKCHGILMSDNLNVFFQRFQI